MDIEKLVQAELQTKIIAAFQETPEMIESLIGAVLNREVTEHGGNPGWNDKKIPWLEYACRNVIERVALECVREHIKTMAETIDEHIKAALSTDDMVQAFSQAIAGSVKDDWKISAYFKVDKMED